MKLTLAIIIIALFTSFYLFAFSKANDRYTREQNELDSLRKEVKTLRQI
jgi:preprotein translocase subunit YajC